VVPFVTKGVFCPDYRFERYLKGISAGLTDVTMAKMKESPAGNRLLYGLSAHITGKGLHGKLLKIVFVWQARN
jgi:hypothetical protein